MRFQGYATEGFQDELFLPDGAPRPDARALVETIDALPPGELKRRQQQAEIALRNLGITFNVYGSKDGVDKVFPFDVVPRVLGPTEWTTVKHGLRQRIRALNQFLDDVYHEQRIVRAGVVPASVVASSRGFRKECVGLDVPHKVWAHVTGTDLVRAEDGRFHVLEDNLRTPSGVSYVLENRQVMKRIFPEVFRAASVQPVETYPLHLLETLQQLSPRPEPTVVVLTPGMHNSAYFEHAYLAQKMGVELVEGSDLVVDGGFVHMRTTKGLQRVDVVYRRIDDDFLDPRVFRKDSALGVPGLMDVFRAGNVALANAPGTGVADDKGVYPYVPDMVQFYLGEKPILPNVPTYKCWEDKEREFVLHNIRDLVVKAVDESGGYGMLIGPHATDEQHEDFRKRIERNPRGYIAQPTLALSRAPCIVDEHFEGRHVDLRPYILHGKEVYVMPGGLTRVALRKGSLVVNSSQGGGSKDTWVLAGF